MALMRRQIGVLVLALGLTGVAAQPGAAQPKLSGPAAAGYTQLFMSPCGEPYRGKPGDPYPAVLWFKQADLNHDGVIDLKEFRADHEGFFDALDADGNGVLDGPELTFYERQVAPDVFTPERLSQLMHPELALASLDGRDGARLILVQQWLPGLQQGPEGGHPGEEKGYNPDAAGAAKGPLSDLGASRRQRKELVAAAPFGLLAEAEPVRAADTDLDGRVTKAEFLAAADRRFKALDKRKDGKLTLDELPMTAWQAAAEKGRGKNRG
jgi:EF hand/EF-hand domain pair